MTKAMYEVYVTERDNAEEVREEIQAKYDKISLNLGTAYVIIFMIASVMDLINGMVGFSLVIFLGLIPFVCVEVCIQAVANYVIKHNATVKAFEEKWWN